MFSILENDIDIKRNFYNFRNDYFVYPYSEITYLNNSDNIFNKNFDSYETLSTFNESLTNRNNIINNNPDETLKKDEFLNKKTKIKGKYKGIHNEFSKDNIFRKIKNELIKELKKFINELIYKTYNCQIGRGFIRKEFKTIGEINIKYIKNYKEFIYKSLKEIFSMNISDKYYNVCKDFNKVLVDKLLNEKDEEKRIIFEKVFNLTFLECIDHFAEKKKIHELEGLTTIKEKFKDCKKDLYNNIEYYALNFEKIVQNGKSRKRKKENKIENN